MNMHCSTLLNNEDGNLLVFWADMFLLVVLSFTRPEHAPNHGWQDPATTLANMIRDLQAQVLCDKVIPINFPSGYWMCIQLSKLICNYDRGLTASYKSWQYVKGWGCLCLAVCRQTSILGLILQAIWWGFRQGILSCPLTASCMCFENHPIATEWM